MDWLWNILELIGISWKKKQAVDAAATIPVIDNAIDAAKKSSDSIQAELNKPPIK